MLQKLRSSNQAKPGGADDGRLNFEHQVLKFSIEILIESSRGGGNSKGFHLSESVNCISA
jgi:hypothetical protein